MGRGRVKRYEPGTILSPGISEGELFGHRVRPIPSPCVTRACVRDASRCLWEQRESTWRRGESQKQAVALTFNSNEALGR